MSAGGAAGGGYSQVIPMEEVQRKCVKLETILFYENLAAQLM